MKYELDSPIVVAKDFCLVILALAYLCATVLLMALVDLPLRAAGRQGFDTGYRDEICGNQYRTIREAFKKR